MLTRQTEDKSNSHGTPSMPRAAFSAVIVARIMPAAAAIFAAHGAIP